MDPLITLDAITITYPSTLFRPVKTILHNFSLQVLPGTTVAIIGNNGTGKSTLLKALCGLLPLQHGNIIIKPSATIGYAPAPCLLPGWLTCLQFLRFMAQLIQLPAATNSAIALLDAVNLSEARNTLIAACSRGMQQRLVIAQALLGNPALLLLDEPWTALDKQGIDIVNRLCFNGNYTVIYTDHVRPTSQETQVICLQ